MARGEARGEEVNRLKSLGEGLVERGAGKGDKAPLVGTTATSGSPREDSRDGSQTSYLSSSGSKDWLDMSDLIHKISMSGLINQISMSDMINIDHSELFDGLGDLNLDISEPLLPEALAAVDGGISTEDMEAMAESSRTLKSL